MKVKHPPTLLVLAAGMGSRYGGLKQIDSMGPGGEWLLEYSIYDALRAGFGKVVFIIRNGFKDVFIEAIRQRLPRAVICDYVFQELDALPTGFSVPEGREKPWGTGHAILQARNEIKENFAVINADDFYGRDAYAKIGSYLSSMRANDGVDDFCMVGYPLKNTLSKHGTVNRGVCNCDGQGFLNGVAEYEKISWTPEGICSHLLSGGVQVFSGEEYASMNLWGFTPSVFDHLERQFTAFLQARGNEMKSELYIPTVVDELISQKKARVKVLSTDSQWFGVTYPEDKAIVLEKIKALVAEGEYPEKLWAAFGGGSLMNGKKTEGL